MRRCGMIHFWNSEGVLPRVPLRQGAARSQALAATFAAALLQMVCAIASKREAAMVMDAIAAKVKTCEQKLAHCAEEDIRAFDRYMDARKSLRGSTRAHVQKCLLASTRVPLTGAEAIA